MVRGQQLPTLYLCIKFEERSFNRLRNIESVAKFRNWAQGCSDGVYRYIQPQNQSTLKFMWLFFSCDPGQI